MTDMKYRFIVEISKTGYSAFELKKPIYTTGDSIHQLKVNALEAIHLLEEGSSKKLSNSSDLVFEIDFQQFFEYYKVINAKHLAKRIGMNETLLSQYVNGRKKPSTHQVKRIMDGLHEIGKELTQLNLV